MCGTQESVAEPSDIPPPLPAGFAVAIAIGMLTILLLLLLARRKAKGKRTTVLIMGPINTGKTTLYLQMKEGSTKNGSVSSMEQNEDTFIPHSVAELNKPMTFVDLPGHPRLADKFDDYIHKAAGIIFVIDGADFMPHTRVIAEQLYKVLSHPDYQANRVPLLIACNKNDLGARVHTENFIEKKLQKEITNVRDTVSTLDGEATGAPVGKLETPFTFQDANSQIGMCKISALDGGDAIKPVYEFLAVCAKHM